MKDRTTILLLEDNEADAELIGATLSEDGLEAELKRVSTEQEFETVLQGGRVDLIISDFSLPSYNGHAALLAAKRVQPDIPFIFFSGTIGEEAAIEALKRGATDYVLKDKPRRLISSIHRAFEDVERRRRQKEMELRNRAQAQLLDLARDAIIVRDLGDRVQYWNKGAERLYGYSSMELLGERMPEFAPPSFPDLFDEAKRVTLETGEWQGEMEHLTRSRKAVFVMSRWTLVRNDQGEPERILEIDTDITERKQLEKQFLRAQRLESVGTLASGIAHDLNNVLGPILMCCELLKEMQHTKEAVEMLEMQKKSAERGAEIVKQLLTFVRGSGGDRTVFKLETLLREVYEVARKTFPRNIQTSLEIEPGLLPIKADLTQMHQVLMNLCINARDAMPNGGDLMVSAMSNPEGNVLIRVEDTGTGIPPDILDKIFDPFFTTKDLTKGTGLGLSTVLGIIKSHGGKITVESRQGVGTAFQFQLPAYLESEDNRNEKRGPARGHGELILVVDDDLAIRESMSRTLSDHGYEVLTAHDGAAAYVHLTRQAQRIRVLVTDVRMPGLDGPSLAKAAKEVKGTLKIVATSGSADTHDIPGADRFLRKPFNPEQLLIAVHGVLGG